LLVHQRCRRPQVLDGVVDDRVDQLGARRQLVDDSGNLAQGEQTLSALGFRH